MPGFWQGIRFEDLILLGYAFYIIHNYNEKIINNHLVQKFLPLLYYFLIIFVDLMLENYLVQKLLI